MKRILLLFIGMLILTGMHLTAQNGKSDTIRKEVIVINKEMQKAQRDSMLVQKLSSEQLMQLKQQEMEVEKEKIEADSKENMPLHGFQILLITMLPFLFVIIIIAIASNSKNKESIRRHEIYLKSIELGQTLPEHFFDEPKKNRNSSNLKKGIILVAIGLSLAVSYFLIGNKFIVMGGIIPAFIGIGFLLVHFLEKPKNEENNEQQNG